MTNASASPRRVLLALGILGVILTTLTFNQVVLPAQDPAAPKAPATQQAPSAPAEDSQLAPPPLSPVEKAEKDGTALRLSLKDLTKLALQNNLDIAISDTNEALYQQKVVQAFGPYDPTLTLRLDADSAKSANTRLETASTLGNFNSNDTAYWNASFQQAVRTGGVFQAQWNTRRTDNNQAFSLFTPQYTATTSFSFTQPLRRNRKIDQYRSAIRLANLDIKINDSKFKQKVVETIASIQSQYWDLVSAIRNYDIKRSSVALAQVQLRDNKRKVDVGTLAPIGVTEAQATVAQREVDMITAEETINQAENALRALISNDRNAEIWHKVVIPTESPDFKEYKVELDSAIDTALKNRPELEQFDMSLKQSDINLEKSENDKKWQFDLTGGFGTVGVSGPQSYRTDNSGTVIPQVPLNLIGGVGNAYKTVFTGGFTNWAVQFQVQIPLRNRGVEAQLAQVKIQRRQTLMQRKSTEQQVQVDVRNAVSRLETSRKQVQTAGVARQLAKEQLDGEEKRFQAGLSQNYLVLQRQNDLSSAQFTELQALITYKKSIINLQKAIYTLLEENDFEIAKGSSGNVPNLH